MLNIDGSGNIYAGICDCHLPASNSGRTQSLGCGHCKNHTGIPTKMCIKFEPYLHQQRANWALNMVHFLCFGADFAH